MRYGASRLVASLYYPNNKSVGWRRKYLDYIIIKPCLTVYDIDFLFKLLSESS
jgi:hypothetical protein